MSEPRPSRGARSPITLVVCGSMMLIGSAAMTWISRWFAYTTDPRGRPLIEFVVLMSVMFVIHLVAFWVAKGSPITHQRRLTLLIWVIAVVSRLLVLPSHPIQEVDLYRYLWDGQVSSLGVSPFRYSPSRVMGAIGESSNDADLAVLALHASGHRSIKTILGRVHYGELPTVYPPVSQAVFRAVASTVPPGANVHSHVIAMKGAIVLFDVAIIAVLFWLLPLAGLSRAWVITYAWNPLVIKEFAGSGHLDSISVFFTVAAVGLTLKAVKDHSIASWVVAFGSLSLGFGAKLFPIVLLPVLLVACYRTAGRGVTAIGGATFSALALLIFLPIVSRGRTESPSAADASVVAEGHVNSGAAEEIPDELVPPIPEPGPMSIRVTGGQEQTPNGDLLELDPIAHQPMDDGVAREGKATRPTDGIEAFLTRWEMNDVVFLWFVENLRGGDRGIWFVITPRDTRDRISRHLGEMLSVSPSTGAFMFARAVTLLIFAVASLWLIWRMDPREVNNIGRVAFLVLALFWALSPTLNPWYWTWALPLVGFARSRGWLLVSGMLAAYYLRFWFLYHEDAAIMQCAPYPGAKTFDYVVVFLEHVPWMACVVVEAVLTRRRKVPAEAINP